MIQEPASRAVATAFGSATQNHLKNPATLKDLQDMFLAAQNKKAEFMDFTKNPDGPTNRSHTAPPQVSAQNNKPDWLSRFIAWTTKRASNYESRLFTLHDTYGHVLGGALTTKEGEKLAFFNQFMLMAYGKKEILPQFETVYKRYTRGYRIRNSIEQFGLYLGGKLKALGLTKIGDKLESWSQNSKELRRKFGLRNLPKEEFKAAYDAMALLLPYYKAMGIDFNAKVDPKNLEKLMQSAIFVPKTPL